MKRLLALFLCLALVYPAVLAEEDEEDSELLIEEIIEEVAETKNEVLDTDGSVLMTITCTGDFTIGGDTYHKKDIFTPELKAHENDINFTMQNMRSYFMEDDLTLVNFEGTFTNTTSVPSNKRNNSFLFSAPPEWVTMLTDNGIEAVSLENNHVMDHGEEGYEDTQRTLTDAGVVWSNSEHIGVYECKGIQIAMLSYLCIDRYDSLWDKVPADIAEAKKYYPLVIVSFHWGNELDYSPTDNQVRMGRLAVDSGADLVIGHHSHRLNPIEYYNGVYICYSLGNFCFAGNTKPSDMSSFVFQMRFRVKDGICTPRGMRIIPIRISSKTNRNDFIPTPYTNDSHINSVLTTLRENGKKLDYALQDYPLSWD